MNHVAVVVILEFVYKNFQIKGLIAKVFVMSLYNIDLIGKL